VGGGRDIFPDNRALAAELAGRCRLVVSVDPSDTVEENRFAHQRVKMRIEDYVSGEPFDLATLRMVAEHIENPGAAVAALSRLMKPNGVVVVYTINKWSPVSLVSWLTPHRLHHPIKHLLWKTDERDTFPVVYKLNTRNQLRRCFGQFGFRERHFTYLDDCRTFHCSRPLHFVELFLWRLLSTGGMRYPENCLLGLYQRTG
jgi:hypothetical protein